MNKKYNVVSLTMCVVCFLALITNSYLITMENRISEMVSISAHTALGNYAFIMYISLLVLVVCVLIKSDDENKNFITGMIASFFIGEVVFFTGFGAKLVGAGYSDTYRITWGMGSYIMLAAWYGIIIKCNQNIKVPFKRFLTTFSAIFIVVMLFATGLMNRMSIVTEFFTREDKFYMAMQEHFSISVIVLISSITIGLPLGYLCYRNKVVNSVIMGFLNIIRSIPSIALIMVMVTPLSFLKEISMFDAMGISSFGFTPVFCALFLYALFQIVNSLSGALKTIDGNYLITAKAMGMTNFMILWKIQIPLVLPVLVSGIRVAIVSTFSAVTLGSMVGYGGLGVFITMGGGSAVALDLILLGAVPIIIMIFIVNFIFGLLSQWLEQRVTGTHSKNKISISNIGE